MRWTEENENILWRTIFETQNISIDLDKVAEAWPGEDKPTPKALCEQLSKYRKAGKGQNTVTFSFKRKTDSPGTPRKRRAASAKKATPKKAKGGSNEKQGQEESEEALESVEQAYDEEA